MRAYLPAGADAPPSSRLPEIKRLHYTSSVDTWAVGCLAFELVCSWGPGRAGFASCWAEDTICEGTDAVH
jgi:serine/threonine protein kinase